MKIPIETQIKFLEDKIQEEIKQENREMLIQCKQSLKEFKIHATSVENKYNVVVTMSEKTYKDYLEFKKRRRQNAN